MLLRPYCLDIYTVPFRNPAQTMFDVIKYDGYFDFGWIQFSFVIRGTATNFKSFEMDPPTKQMNRCIFLNSQL